MIGSISNNLNSLHLAENRMYTASKKVAAGDLDEKNLVDTKLASTDIKAQATVIKTINETKNQILDILA